MRLRTLLPRYVSRFKHGNSRDYALAKLKRDGYTEELAAIKRGETTPHAVAVKLGWRKPRIQILPTVEGFLQANLPAGRGSAPKEVLGNISPKPSG